MHTYFLFKKSIKYIDSSKKINNGIAIPNCEIISGGVKTAPKLRFL